jgi:hypothetical protein
MELEILEKKEVGIIEKLRIHTYKDLTPFEFGQLLIYIEDIYRLLSVFLFVHRSPKKIMGGYWRDKEYSNDKLFLNPKMLSLLNEIKEGEDLLKEIFNGYSFFFLDINSWKSIYNFTDKIPNKLQLQLVKITYNSPCKIDVLGIGEIVLHIKDFILQLIKLKTDKEKHRSDLLRDSEEIKRIRIENLEKLLSLSKDYNVEISTLNRLISDLDEKQEFFFELVKKDKLVKVETLQLDE